MNVEKVKNITAIWKWFVTLSNPLEPDAVTGFSEDFTEPFPDHFINLNIRVIPYTGMFTTMPGVINFRWSHFGPKSHFYTKKDMHIVEKIDWDQNCARRSFMAPGPDLGII